MSFPSSGWWVLPRPHSRAVPGLGPALWETIHPFWGECPGAGVGVADADPADTGKATKAGMTMSAPSNEGLV